MCVGQSYFEAQCLAECQMVTMENPGGEGD